MNLEKLYEKIPYDKLYPVPVWQRFAATFGVAAIIVGIFYFLVIAGQEQQIDKLQENLADINKQVADNKLHAQKLGKLMEKIARLDIEAEKAAKHLPTEKEIPELLEQVSNIGTQVGLEFITFKPRPEIRGEFYSQVPVQISVTGRFHNIMMFFDEIAHLPRIVTIGNITLKKDKKSSKLTLNSLVTTYRFLEPKDTKKSSKKDAKSNKGRQKAQQMINEMSG